MNPSHFISIYAALLLFIISSPNGFSQPYSWESAVEVDDIEDDYIVKSSYGDLYGLHIIAAKLGTGNSRHYLVGNDGNQIGSYYTFASSSIYSAVTGWDGKLFVATDVSNDIKLYISDDGGMEPSNWDTYDYEPSAGITIQHIDIHADDNGVHIVWDNEANDEVYYVRFVPGAESFDLFRNVTDATGAEGIVPSVTSSGDEVHVSFTKLDEDPDVGASIDLDFSGATPTWDSDYELTPEPAGGEDAEHQSLAVLGTSRLLKNPVQKFAIG